ncbi:molybdopterin-dependent oxidoreductase [Auraticoccus monumenti]|uniref:DMSO/TMAO reductase YedYZ, molybdopterin-dependent catalytic subunit n=1 Tax=Auraticoccus monumenti TaxID=675864 RepID=A0A1G6UCB7_9ACTN|nr:molybdopterin-dependent oxidoreductase [Auraticoccus monumenti]SDD38225.1 DMSO/TMAO reductase YedYZ, molybdopterin-dependent catalytic subunit [Auraticoccus monumenti]
MSTTTAEPAAAPAEPRRGVRALVGLASAAIALSLGHLTSLLTGAASSPAVLVGSQLVDAAPTPVKAVVVRLLGTADKPILIGGVVVVTLLVGALLGLLAWRRPQLANLGIVAIGAVGLVVALTRPGLGLGGAVPSVVAIAAGVTALQVLVNVTSPRPGEPVGSGPNRRRVLLGGLGSAAVVALSAGGGALLSGVTRAGDAARRMFTLPTAGSPAPPLPEGVQVPGNTPFSTSIEDFYRIDISLVTPRHEAEGWSLTIDGEVDNPLTLSYDELLAMPMIERDITLTCVSNEVGGPYVGTARWLGVPFAEIISRVGVRPGSDMLLSHSLDGGYTCSTPVAALTDRDAMVAIGMNGEVLPDKNGFPARMVVPGLFGYVSATKWLERLEFSRFGAQTAYWTDRGWAEQGPILTQSRIDVPDSLGTITPDKPVLAGVAWAQHRGIAKVELRIDDGEWQEAKLAEEGGIDLWRQWSFVYEGSPGRHKAEVRATDKTGDTQPEARQPVFPAGATGWHTIQFTLAD